MVLRLIIYTLPNLSIQPQFIDLADIWMGLQDEVIILSSINNSLWELQSLSNKVLMHSLAIDLNVLLKHTFRMIYVIDCEYL